MWQENFRFDESIYDFREWAFGDGMRLLDQMVDRWNSRHGDLMLVQPSDVIGEALAKMIVLWRQVGKK